MGSFGRNFLVNAFGRPRGVLGGLGGIIMARKNRKCAAWVASLLEVQSNDKVLEIGFGPGVGIELLAQAAAGGYVFGIDPSKEMLDQAASRNARAIESGHVDLRLGSAEALPFKDNSFDKAMAINSLHLWSDAIAGLREVRRVMKPGGRIACGFTRNSGQRKDGLIEKFCAAGFTNVRLAETDQDFCVLAVKP
jgi:ubiquinone/menaquinone biosynthesis C-methylase UbiE